MVLAFTFDQFLKLAPAPIKVMVKHFAEVYVGLALLLKGGGLDRVLAVPEGVAGLADFLFSTPKGVPCRLSLDWLCDFFSGQSIGDV